LFSGNIFARHNANHSLFTSQDGQLTEISCTHQSFSFSNGLVFKAKDNFTIQSRSGEFDLGIVAETPRFSGSAPSRTPYRVNGRSYRLQETKLSPQIAAHRKFPAPKPQGAKSLPRRAQFL
jgi:hypothetical protein